MHKHGPGKYLHPSLGNFFIRPIINVFDVNSDHDVVVVTHYRVCAQIDREYGADELDAIHDPLAAMFEIKSRAGVYPTQKGATYTS